jgi:hypothetical protein
MGSDIRRDLCLPALLQNDCNLWVRKIRRFYRFHPFPSQEYQSEKCYLNTIQFLRITALFSAQPLVPTNAGTQTELEDNLLFQDSMNTH